MKLNWTATRRSIGAACAAFALFLSTTVFAQNAPPPLAQPSEPRLLSPDQLDNLVAPIALYPDPLLSQLLAASTYPLEIVEAQQWLQQNRNLQGKQLMDAARQQNWDPSVQALVAFPDVMTMLTRDVQWTTDLGNAFLAQQKDVMAAIQTMRRRAQQNGKLTSTAQETVTTQAQDGQSAVVIQPADPQVIYVPVYNPVYVWGPPAWGYYPPLWYPGVGFGFGFGPGIYLGGFFPGWGIGWGGWGLGWGWGFGWFGGGLYVNGFFFNHYGFHGGYYGGFAGGRAAWAHDSFHRAGVPYANRSVAAQYNNSRFQAGRYSAGSAFNGSRSATNGGWQRLGNNTGQAASRGFSSAQRSNTGGSNRTPSAGNYSRSYSNQGSNRSYSSPTPNRSYSSPSYNRSYSNQGSNRSYSSASPNRSYSTPNSNRSYSAPSTGHGSAAPSGRSVGGGARGGRR